MKPPLFCMDMNGKRTPTWGMLLDFCDIFPINFGWLRTGTGPMVRYDNEESLLRKIEELEKRIKELETNK